jgi:hypothetical protein
VVLDLFLAPRATCTIHSSLTGLSSSTKLASSSFYGLPSCSCTMTSLLSLKRIRQGCSPTSEPPGQTVYRIYKSIESTRSTRIHKIHQIHRPTADPAMISVSTDDLCDDLPPLLIFCRSAQIESKPQTHALFWLRFDCFDQIANRFTDLTVVITSQVASLISAQLFRKDQGRRKPVIFPP